MTDDELQDRLRRLAARPDADWDAMAAAVRDGYEAATQRRSVVRRRRWATSIGGALAMAAALALYVGRHHPPAPPVEDEMTVDEPDTDELIDELTPAQLERVAKAFHKGA